MPYSVLLFAYADETSSTCTRSPIITGYTRPHGTLVYNFTWKLSTCHSNINQFEIQFVESCSITQPVTVSTGNNRTTTLIVIPSCAASGCYVRVRAEMTDQMFTNYSPCVFLTSNFPEHKRKCCLHNNYNDIVIIYIHCILPISVCWTHTWWDLCSSSRHLQSWILIWVLYKQSFSFMAWAK